MEMGAAVIEPCPAFEAHRACMAASSAAWLKQFRVETRAMWPCGHLRTPETTHTIAGIGQCKPCRRARWRKRFMAVVAKHEHRNCATRITRFTPQDVRAKMIAELVEGSTGRLPVDVLLASVAASFGMTAAVLRGESRLSEVVNARSVVVRILHERGCSYPVIGKLLGGRDHSTMMNAHQKFDIYARRDPRVCTAYLAFCDRKAA